MSIIQTESIDELRATIADWREAGDSIALVPTMGNLHRGHTSMIQLARDYADRVMVSIFVNPTQFGLGEDFASYPRTLELDMLQLRRTRASLVFSPELSDVYPFGQGGATRVHVPELTNQLCGEFRPGYFDGVATVFLRFLFMAQPDVVVLGQKDYQQLLVIRRLVSDMSIPLKVISAPTVRESDGLAMSSRNQNLTGEERNVAPELYRAIGHVAGQLRAGRTDYANLEAEIHGNLHEHGFDPEYVAIRDSSSLTMPSDHSEELVIMCAARLGSTRLIDNLLVELTD